MKNVEGTLTLKGVGGQLAVDEHFLTIHRKGGLAKVNHGLKGIKRIPLKNVVAVQVKKPGLTNGYIQFTLSGGVENKGGVFAAQSDENSVTFNSRHKDDAYAIQAYVEHYIIHGSAPTSIEYDSNPEDTPELTETAEPSLPPPTPGPPPPPTPAAWHPDPFGRFELRYWDGTKWTDHVSTGGTTGTDPANQ